MIVVSLRELDMRTIAYALALFMAVAVAHAGEEPKAGKERLPVGADAPEITAKTWLNTEGGETPVLPDLTGKVIMLEFWGTWCGPCVRSMPKIQSLHERYKDAGLIVIAITREKADEVRGFLEKKSYTMPVGCDPEQTCVGKYSVAGWPTTYLVGANGTILYSGSPYGVEPAIEKALGLESSTPALLSTYFAACAGKDKDAERKAIERLLEKSSPAFDLKSWAERALGEAPDEAIKAKPLKGAKELTALAKSWKTEPDEKQTLALTALALGAPTEFDLESWVRERYAKGYPLKSKEVEALLEKRRYMKLLDAMIDRNASSGVIKKAAKHDGFRRWASEDFQQKRTLARKAIMALHYWMLGEAPKDYDDEAFARDLAINGIWMNKERNRVLGVIIAGDRVSKEGAAGYAERQLQRWFLMDAIGRGKSEKVKALPGKAKKEYDKIRASLKRMYG